MSNEVKLRRIGNSKGVILPADMLHELDIKEGDLVQVESRENEIVIRKPKPAHDIFGDD